MALPYRACAIHASRPHRASIPRHRVTACPCCVLARQDRKRMAMEFKGANTEQERAALEQETREMMQAVCASPRGGTPIFETTCAKLQAR